MSQEEFDNRELAWLCVKFLVLGVVGLICIGAAIRLPGSDAYNEAPVLGVITSIVLGLVGLVLIGHAYRAQEAVLDPSKRRKEE